MVGSTVACEDLYLKVVEYCRLLRANGVHATTSKALDAMEALKNIDLLNARDFRLTLRITLAASVTELEIFDRVFDSYWNPRLQDKENPDVAQDSGDENINDTKLTDKQVIYSRQPEKEWVQVEGSLEASYSPLESLGKKDFSTFQPQDIAAFARVSAQIGRKLATRQSRRLRQSRRGSPVDFRRTFRRNLGYGGIMLELVHKRRKILKPRLVLLCDVSRSMDEYARFLLHFAYTLRNVFSHVEAFVFGTQLTRVTKYLDTRDILAAVEQISHQVPDWSGGTRIGESIQAFNEKFASAILNNRTVTIVLSDGLDTGNPELLEREIKILRRRARRLVWLNPLLSDPGYEPVSRGMSAVLPHVDDFFPAHNLASLQRLERYA